MDSPIVWMVKANLGSLLFLSGRRNYSDLEFARQLCSTTKTFVINAQNKRFNNGSSGYRINRLGFETIKYSSVCQIKKKVKLRGNLCKN